MRLFNWIILSVMCVAFGCDDSDDDSNTDGTCETDTTGGNSEGDSDTTGTAEDGVPAPGPDGCYWHNVPDAISAASQPYYYTTTQLEGEDLLRTLSPNSTMWEEDLAREDTTVSVMATVRCDGTPNIAIYPPSAVTMEVLSFYMPHGITRTNIEATKYARLLLRIIDPDGKNKYDDIGRGGARLLLKLVEDENEKAGYYSTIEAAMEEEASGLGEETSLGDYVFMRIIHESPVG